MKKFGFLAVLLCVIFLAACNHEVYDMTFDEAVKFSSQSDLNDFILKADNYQTTTNLSTSIESEDSSFDGELHMNCRDSLSSMKSEMSIAIKGGVVASGMDMNLEGKLDLKVLPEIIYLNLDSLDLTGDDSFVMMNALLEGFKNQWFSIPSTGDASSLNIIGTYIKSIQNSDFDYSQLYVNEGEGVYSGKYSEFDGLNAWKFSLDETIMSEFMDQYYDTIKTSLESSGLGSSISGDLQQSLDITDFEGYLIITGKDKVVEVIENMTILVDGISMDISMAYGNGEYKFYASTSGTEILSFEIVKHRSQYDIQINFPGYFEINGKANSKMSEDSINLDYDFSVSVDQNVASSMYGLDTEMPSISIEGNWNIDLISEFDIEEPENAQDLVELLGNYFGGTDIADEENLELDDVEYFGESEE